MFLSKIIENVFHRKSNVGEKQWVVIVFTITTPMNWGVLEGDCHRAAISTWHEDGINMAFKGPNKKPAINSRPSQQDDFL